MDLIKFLNWLEDIMYEILMSIIFIPRTLYKIIVSPSGMNQYVLVELEKEKGKFDTHLSPIILFILLIAIPISYFNFSPLQIISEISPETKQELDKDFQLSVLINGLYILLTPLMLAILINNKEIDKISKSGLKPAFQLLCYAYVPPQVLSIIFAFIISKGYLNSTSYFISTLVIPIVWLIWRVSSVIRLQPGISYSKSIFLSLWYYVLSTVILTIMTVTILMVNTIPNKEKAAAFATIENAMDKELFKDLNYPATLFIAKINAYMHPKKQNGKNKPS